MTMPHEPLLHPLRALALGAALASLLLPQNARADWLAEGSASPIQVFDGVTGQPAANDEENRRGMVTIRRIDPECYSDWNNDPTALPYLFYQLDRRTQKTFPVYVDNSGIKLTDDDIFDYPIIYFTSHYTFNFSAAEIENVQKFLAQGGTLWLDDCTGSGPFMDAVPVNVQRLSPGAETHLMLLTDERFRDLFKLVYELHGLPDLREDFRKPLQATLVNGRPGIIFCPNDYGCWWEVSTPPTALNPLGNPAHDPPSPKVQRAREQVYQFSINWLLYTLTH